MRIERISVQNFRCFEKYELRLAPRFTLLIGDNGAGKSALLDIIGIALGGFMQKIPHGPSRPIATEDVRRQDFALAGRNGEKTVSPSREYVGPVNIAARAVTQDGKALEWGRSRRRAATKVTFTMPGTLGPFVDGLVSKVSVGRHVVLPVIAYYGTGRLWNQSKFGLRTGGGRSRFAGYNDCFEPAAQQLHSFRWFKTNELAILQKGVKRPAYEAAKHAVTAMIPDAHLTFWDVEWNELRIVYEAVGKQRTIPFKHLSDGYRNMVGIAADLAHRMATLNPHLRGKALQDTPGIVLIDEIDLHLHPKWQREVVGRLLSIFPRIQFVATTHSPFIIQSLHNVDNTAIWDIAKAGLVAVESKSIEDIAEEKQGVRIPQQSRRYLEMMQAAEKYYAKLREAEHRRVSKAELARLRKELDQLSMPFSDDPALQALMKQERIAAGIDQKGDG